MLDKVLEIPTTIMMEQWSKLDMLEDGMLEIATARSGYLYGFMGKDIIRSKASFVWQIIPISG